MAESRENKYDQHFRLDLEGAVAYTREVLDFFSKDAKLKGEEIGDGNINYVFRVWEEGGEESALSMGQGGRADNRPSG